MRIARTETLDDFGQLFNINGLRHVTVEPFSLQTFFVSLHGKCGQGNDGNVLCAHVRFQKLERRSSIHARQLHIHQDECRESFARLLVIGTYRPVEVLTHEHHLKAVKQGLQVHGYCQELALDFLSEAAVAEYLTQRLSAPSPASAGEGRGEGLSRSSLQRMAHVIHRRTDGNPLFMVNVMTHLLSQGVLTQVGGQWVLKNAELAIAVPENLRQMIEQRLMQVSPAERAILEVGSVAGAEFSAVAVATGAEQSTEAVEAQCDTLVHREQFLRARGTREWPDGTSAARYGFVHALYQEVLYEQISASRRVRLHRQIGERGEQAYGERAREIAAELAVHFERGRDHRKAIKYLQYAGENAVQHSAYQEAISLLTKGLELLQTLPDTPERVRQELRLQITLGPPLQATQGYGSPEVEGVYARARELCQQVEDPRQLFPVLGGLLTFYLERGESQTARALGEQYFSLGQRLHNPTRLLWSHYLLGLTLFHLGEFVPSRGHLEQGVVLYDLKQHRSLAFLSGGVACLSLAAWVVGLLGYPDQTLKRSHEALTLAQELAHPYSLAFALNVAAMLHQLHRQGQAAQERAEALITLSTEQGFAPWAAEGTMLRGWALTTQGKEEEGITQMQQGLAAWRATGVELERPYWLALLAEAYGKVGRVKEGLSVLAEALAQVDKTGARLHEAELYRLKGELTLQQFNVQGSKFKVQSRKSAIRIPQSAIRSGGVFSQGN